MKLKEKKNKTIIFSKDSGSGKKKKKLLNEWLYWFLFIENYLNLSWRYLIQTQIEHGSVVVGVQSKRLRAFGFFSAEGNEFRVTLRISVYVYGL